MKALLIAAPCSDASSTMLTEIPDLHPGRGELLVQVAYAGINFLDIMARRGDPGYVAEWPYVPGLEVAGTVRAVGDEVSEEWLGRRVAAFIAGGGLAEWAAVPVTLAVAVPDEVSLKAAAAAPLGLASAVALLVDVVRLRPGESVVMHSSAGGVGGAVAQVAAALGAGPRIGLVGGHGRVEAARRAGWPEVLVIGEDTAEQVAALVPGGVDVVLDPTGTANLELDLAIAAPGGRIVVFGNPAGGPPAPLPPLGRLLVGNVGLFGFSMTNLRRKAPHRVTEALTTALTMLADERIAPPLSVVDGLAEAPAIHDQLANRNGTGKYVVQVGPAD